MPFRRTCLRPVVNRVFNKGLSGKLDHFEVGHWFRHDDPVIEFSPHTGWTVSQYFSVMATSSASVITAFYRCWVPLCKKIANDFGHRYRSSHFYPTGQRRRDLSRELYKKMRVDLRLQRLNSSFRFVFWTVTKLIHEADNSIQHVNPSSLRGFLFHLDGHIGLVRSGLLGQSWSSSRPMGRPLGDGSSQDDGEEYFWGNNDCCDHI